jgi:hypothetical protein
MSTQAALAVRIALVLVFIASTVMAATVMNGKEVKAYVGHIVSHNDRKGEIVIKTDTSTGHWKLNPHTVVFSGKDRIDISEIWRRSKKVQVHVSADGEVQRISVLEWK